MPLRGPSFIINIPAYGKVGSIHPSGGVSAFVKLVRTSGSPITNRPLSSFVLPLIGPFPASLFLGVMLIQYLVLTVMCCSPPAE